MDIEKLKKASEILLNQDNQNSISHFPANALILGFTGSLGSGCSLFAETIGKVYEYRYYSLSDIIYTLAKKIGANRTRKDLQDIGNFLRSKYGKDILARYLIKNVDKDCKENTFDKIIVDSIRNDIEVSCFKQFSNFYLISIYADKQVRHKRLEVEDSTYSLDAFQKDDERDAEEKFSHGQQVKRCNDMADIVINNDKKTRTDVASQRKNYIENKFRKYRKLIEEGPSYEFRPSVEEKMMTLAYMESLMSSCLQRKVGAVIATEDGQIVSTGYNDVPPSEAPCMDEYGQCYRNFLKEKTADKINNCPKCGKEVDPIKCANCGEQLESYLINCPKCHTRMNIICECGCDIFDEFVPGGRKSVGKLLDVCRSLHAEENAILRIGKLAHTTPKDKTLYCTTYPCNLCANKIVEVGIKKVVYNEPYTMLEAEKIFINKNITVTKFAGVKSSAYFKLYKL